MICFTVPFKQNLPIADYTPPVFGEDSASFYGKPIPISTGTRRLIGVCLWASKIRTYRSGLELTNNPDFISDQSFDPGPFADFAVGFGYRGSESGNVPTIIKAVRIWANGKLIMDRKVDFTKIYTGSDAPLQTELFRLDYTIYSGTEEQEPDPTIVAEEGIQNTPAFRGMVYIVFKDFPLSKVGTGAIPDIKVELADKADGFNAIAKFQKNNINDGTDNQLMVANWAKRRFTVWNTTEAVTYSMDTLKEVSRFPLDPRMLGIGLHNASFTFQIDDKIRTIVSSDASNFYRRLYLLDVENGLLIQQLGNNTNSLGGGIVGVNQFEGMQYATFVLVSKPFRGDISINRCYILVGGRTFGGDTIVPLFYNQYEDTLEPAYNSAFDRTTGFGAVRGITRGNGKLATVNFKPASIVYVATVNRLLKTYVFFDTINGDDVIFSQYYHFETSDSIGGVVSVSNVFRDPNDGNIIVWLIRNGTAEVVKIRTDENLIYNGSGTIVIDDEDKMMWRTVGVGAPSTLQISNLVVRGSEIAFVLGGGNYWSLNMATGRASVKAADFADNNVDGGNVININETTSACDPLQDVIYSAFMDSMSGPGNLEFEYRPSKIYLDQVATDRVPLRNLLFWYCRAAGYQNSDITIDASLSQTITGSIINQRVKLYDLFEQLKNVFGFDKYESGGKIKIRKIIPGETYDYDFVIPDGVTAALDGEGGKKYLRTEIQTETEIPAGIEIRYLDEDADYAINVQRAKRRQFPVSTTDSDAFQAYAVPIIMTGGEALQYANDALWRLQAENMSQNFRLDWSYLAMEPSDILSLTFEDRLYSLKVFEVMLNGDMSLSIGARTLALSANRDYVVDNPIKTPDVIEPRNLSLPIIMDVAFITDGIIPDLPETINYGISAGPEETITIWPPVSVYRLQGSGLTSKAKISVPPTRGKVTAKLPAPGELGGDFVSFKLINGLDTEFVAQSADDAGAGLQMIAVGAPGRWELIGHQTVSYDSITKVVTLGGLIRELKATSDAAQVHRVTDEVVLYRQSDYQIQTFEVSEAGAIHTYKAAKSPDDLAVSSTVSYRVIGLNLSPIGPGALRAFYVGSDIVFEWKRRDRKNVNDFEDLTDDVPNSDPPDRFKIEILNSSGVVLRTDATLTASTYIYLAADITTDFGSMPESVRIRVAQAGNIIPFGIPTDETLDIYNV